MTKEKKLYITAALIFVGVLVIDQWIKISVKTDMALHEKREVFSWFQINFVENNGMAFGWELFGKYFLTIFRLVAVCLIGWYIVRQIKRSRKTGYIVCLSLIMAGAAGNIIDCMFYGLWFTESTPSTVATWAGSGEGYQSFMLGRVVDMFYFPIFEWEMPDWGWVNNLPFIPAAGEHCTFFSAIFNFADAVISCSIVVLFLFYRKQLELSSAGFQWRDLFKKRDKSNKENAVISNQEVKKQEVQQE